MTKSEKEKIKKVSLIFRKSRKLFLYLLISVFACLFSQLVLIYSPNLIYEPDSFVFTFVAIFHQNKRSLAMNQIFAFIHSIRLFQIIGICPFSVDKNHRPVESRKMLFYSLFQIGLSVLGLVGSFYECKLYLNRIKNNVGNAVDFFQLVGMKITHFVIICESLYQQKTLIAFFTSLCEFDDAMKQVNINVRFKSSRTKNIVVLFVELIFYFGLPLIPLIILIIRHNYHMINYFASYILPHLVCCFRYVQVISCVWFIKRRFELLNERLAEINLQDAPMRIKAQYNHSFDFKLYFKELKCFKQPQPLKNFEQIILMRQMYDKLYNLSLMVNYSFGLSNLINVANDFVSLTSNSYFVFLSSQKSPFLVDDAFHIAQTFLWSLPHLVNIVTISAICHFTVQVVSIF